MRRCPNCNRLYPSSETYNYCRYDGTSLLTPDEASEAPTIEARGDGPPTLRANDPMPPKNIDAIEKAVGLETKRQQKELSRDLRDSAEGLKLAEDEVDSLLNLVQIQVVEVSRSAPSLQIELLILEERQAALVGSGYGVKISWQNSYGHLRESRLVIVEYKRKTETDFERLIFDFMFDPDFRLGWKQREESRFLTSEKLAAECIDRLLSLIKTERN